MNKRYLLLIFSFVILLCTTIACDSNKKEVSKTKEDIDKFKIEDTSNQYVEEEISIPKNITHISDVCQMNDGKLRIAGYNLETADQIGGIWESVDFGSTWNLIYDYSDLMGSAVDGEIEVIDTRMSPTKDAVIHIAVHKSDGTEGYYYFTLNTDTKELIDQQFLLPIVNENKLQFVDYLNEKTFFGNDIFRQAYVINTEDNSATPLLADGEEMYAYEYRDNTLYILTRETIKAFDMDTRKQKDTKNQYDEFLSNFSMNDTQNGLGFELNTLDNDEKLFYSNSQGLFFYDGNIAKKLVDGSKTIFSNEVIYLQEIITLNEEQMLSCIQKDNKVGLYKYTKTSSIQEISEEINIYSLYENKNINQAANLYQSKNNDIKVTIEIGLPEEGETTISEAIKALNLKMAGGDGPDIIILDGLNIDNYIEQNLLADISDVIEEANKKNILFSNISQTYFNENKVFAIPTRFSPILVEMNNSDKNDFKTITEFTNYIIKQAEENPQIPVIDAWDYHHIVSALYRSYLDEMVVDQQISEESLTLFYQSIEKLYQMVDMSEAMQVEGRKLIDINIVPYPIGSIDLMAGKNIQIAVDYAVAYFEVKFNQVAEEIADVIVEPMRFNEHNYFVPQTILSINNVSKKIKTAKDFVKFALSEEVQDSYQIAGLPVNKKLLKSQLSSMEEEGVSFVNEEGDGQVASGIFKPFTEEKINQYISQMEGLEKATSMDSLLMEIIMEQADNILDGSMQIEEAVKNASSKVNLYLSE